MITLAIEAATYVASVAVLDGARVRTASDVTMRGADEERLLPAIAAALAGAGVRPSQLGRVVCGAGPGSFTSLRIAASIGKGLATGARVPMYAVSSLALLVASSDATRPAGRYVAALDALRGEYFTAMVTVGAGAAVMQVGPVERWPTAELEARAAQVGVLVGPGLAVDVRPSASAISRLEPILAGSTPLDLARWEPEYGRLAEAQVKWEAAHGRPLQT